MARYSGWTEPATTMRFDLGVHGQGHQGGLGHGGAAVVEAGVGDVHAGELGDQGLVFEDGLEGALAGLGLVGGVGGVEFAAGGEVIDDGGDEVVVSACAEEAGWSLGPLVRGGEGMERWVRRDLGERGGDVERAVQAEGGGHLVEELVEGVEADGVEHFARIGGGVEQVGHAGSSQFSKIEPNRGVTAGPGQAAESASRLSSCNVGPALRLPRSFGQSQARRRIKATSGGASEGRALAGRGGKGTGPGSGGQCMVFGDAGLVGGVVEQSCCDVRRGRRP